MTAPQRQPRRHKQFDLPYPDDDEDEDSFMDRCTGEVTDAGVDDDTAETLCEMAWEDRSANADGVIHRTHIAPPQGKTFVMSDETIDRYGDVISADGWDLDDFKKNPVALFGHKSSDPPIGEWHDLEVVDRSLRGRLELEKEGTSPRIDEIRKLVEHGILRAVSVGFRPQASRPRKSEKGEYIGEYFEKQTLLECSLVSVPANPNAVAIVKSLNISPATLDLVFAGHGRRGKATRRRGFTGGPASNQSKERKGPAMPTTQVAQRVQDAQAHHLALCDELNEHLASLNNDNVSDSQMEKTQDINQRIEHARKVMHMWEDTEKSLGQAAAANSDSRPGTSLVPVRPGSSLTIPNASLTSASPRPFSASTKKVPYFDYMVRQGVVKMFAHARRISTDAALALTPWRHDENTRLFCDYVEKAATAPALTTQTGWAQELAQLTYASFMELLYPKSVFPRLSAMGMSLSFGNAAQISVPTRSQTPMIAGSFVGEGQPIRVAQGLFTSKILTMKKLGVITTFSREMSEHSIPAIEGILRNAMQEDTAITIDQILLDNNAATTIRPAGIFNGVTPLTPATGGGFAAIVADLKGLLDAILTGTAGNIRNLAWLMNPTQKLALSLAAAPGAGVFPFQAQVDANNLLGYPTIDSGTVPIGTVGAIDAADFVSVGAEAPRFEISDSAVIHEEDTAPLPITAPGAPPTVAAPVRSLWQTDSLAIRLVLPLNWDIRRTGVVSWVQGVSW